MYRLISHLRAPPGAYFYRFLFVNGVETTFYGDKNTPNVHTFGPAPIPGHVASNLRLFRKANNLPGAGIGECMAVVDLYTCARLENNSRWCYDTDQAFHQLAAGYQNTGCAGCGAKI